MSSATSTAMKTSVAHALAIVCLLVIGLYVGNLPAFANGTIHYEISIEDFNSHKAQVVMRVPLENGQVKLREIDYIGPFKKILELNAYNSDGVTPATIAVTGSFPYSAVTFKEWTVTASGQNEAVIKYTVEMKDVPAAASDKNHKGYIGKGFALFEGGQLLLTPSMSYLKFTENEYSVSFKVPANAEIITPWKSEGGLYYPNKGITTLKFIDRLNPWYRLNETIAIGAFEKMTTPVGSTELILAVPQSFTKETKEKLLKSLAAQMAYYTKLFGEAVGDTYMIALSETTHDGISIWAGEGTFSQGAMFDPGNFSYDMIGHQLFHRWNGWIYGWNSDSKALGLLLREGNNRYYESKSVLASAKDMSFISSNRAFLRESDYKQYKERYYADTRAYASFDARAVTPDDGWLGYNKGALICLMLDMRMLEDTNGQAGLDELHARMYKQFGRYRGQITKEWFLSEIKAITGKDYTEFFTQYVSGNKTLEMDQYFTDEDGDDVPYYMERSIGTDPKTYEIHDYRYRKNLGLKSTRVVIGTEETYGKMKEAWSINKRYESSLDAMASKIVWINDGSTPVADTRLAAVFNDFRAVKEKTPMAIEMKTVDGQDFILVQGSPSQCQKLLADNGMPFYDGFWDHTPPVLKTLKSNVAKLTLKSGQTQVLKVIAVMSDGSNEALTSGLKFTSSNAGVVKVDAAGKLKALKKGTAVITAIEVGSKKTVKWTVVVK